MNKNEDGVFAFMDEEGDYCVIVGTNDRVRAEKVLRDVEDEWYGKNHEEKPIPMDDFSHGDIYYGIKKGEEGYYWGDKDPKDFFDDGKYVKTEGFIAVVS